MNSEIKSFYSKSNILITGGTGLIGKLLIQKLIRECEDIGNLYLIIRTKKEKSANERRQELFNDIVFKKMKEKVPNFLEKIVVLEGDCSLPALGINPSEQNIVRNQVNIVFHCAASMSMDATLKMSVSTNVSGLNELMDLCQEIKNLKAMVFVSTAYSNCIHPVIEERFYEVPIQATTLIKFVNEVDDNILEKITPALIDKWPNTYCFTKAVAEDMFLQRTTQLPAGLFRPTIVMPTYEDPVPGWTSNIYGPVGVMLAAGLGLQRILFAHSQSQCDLIPADYCVNALICTAWDIDKQSRKSKELFPLSKTPVYNYSGGPKRNITWATFGKYCLQYEYPFKNALWPTVVIQTSNTYWYYILWLILHIIPGCIIDMCLYLTGNKTKVMKAYRKIWKFNNVLKFFSTNEWNIVNTNSEKLWTNLNDIDKEIFPLDMNQIDYRKFLLDTCTGIKLYILKEDLSNVENEKRHYRRMVVLHTGIKYIIFLSITALTWAILKLFFHYLYFTYL